MALLIFSKLSMTSMLGMHKKICTFFDIPVSVSFDVNYQTLFELLLAFLKIKIFFYLHVEILVIDNGKTYVPN